MPEFLVFAEPGPWRWLVGGPGLTAAELRGLMDEMVEAGVFDKHMALLKRGRDDYPIFKAMARG